MNSQLAYEILGIENHERDIEIIKKKYRMMALLYHPDKNPDSSTTDKFFKILPSLSEYGLAVSTFS